MFISTYWISLRINIIYSILTDSLLYFFLIFLYQSRSLDLNMIFFNSAFLFFWLLMSYIIGRYQDSDTDLIIFIKHFFFSIINFFILFSFGYFSIYKFLNFKDNKFFNQNFLFFLKYIFLSFLVQFILKNILKNKFNFIEEWNVLGSSKFFNKLSKNINTKIKLNLISLEDIIYDETKLTKNIVVENLSNLNHTSQKEVMKLNFKGFNVVSIINWCEMVLHRIPLNFLEAEELLNFFSNVNRNNSFQIRLKRIGDIFFSMILILLLLPLLIFFAFLIYFEDRGPIFYFQKRVGKNGKNFNICKLRTMNINAEKDGIQWSKKIDSRITKVGKFLRSTRIDETPQLFMVLFGDMSLIGPRPERPEIDETLKEKIPFYELRYLVKPGLSGWAQVNYPYGSSINDSEAKLTYDFFYIKNFSSWLDLLIFFKTIRLVSRREGSNPIN